MSMPRTLIVLFGATGFTGRLAAEYLAQHVPPSSGNPRWALAGRSLQKLTELRENLRRINPNVDAVPLITADVDDEASLRAMARQAFVVANTVGPYRFYGEPVVKACISEGAHYLDINGEPAFIARIIANYHDLASSSGVLVVPSCGFDSIPADIGTYYTLMKAGNKREAISAIDCYVDVKGGASYGTWSTLIYSLANSRSERAMRESTSNAKSSHAGSNAKAKTRIHYSREVRAWGIPLPTSDSYIVRRSKQLLAPRIFPEDFRYGHYLQIHSFLKLCVVLFGLGILFLLCQFRVGVKLLLKLKSPGEGPSATARKRHYFHLTFVTRKRGTGGTAIESAARTVVSGGDPGYDETSKMLIESALCLVDMSTRGELEGRGGVLTTAAAMGNRLVERLRTAGIVFEDL